MDYESSGLIQSIPYSALEETRSCHRSKVIIGTALRRCKIVQRLCIPSFVTICRSLRELLSGNPRGLDHPPCRRELKCKGHCKLLRSVDAGAYSLTSQFSPTAPPPPPGLPPGAVSTPTRLSADVTVGPVAAPGVSRSPAAPRRGAGPRGGLLLGAAGCTRTGHSELTGGFSGGSCGKSRQNTQCGELRVGGSYRVDWIGRKGVCRSHTAARSGAPW